MSAQATSSIAASWPWTTCSTFATTRRAAATEEARSSGARGEGITGVVVTRLLRRGRPSVDRPDPAGSEGAATLDSHVRYPPRTGTDEHERAASPRTAAGR